MRSHTLQRWIKDRKWSLSETPRLADLSNHAKILDRDIIVSRLARAIREGSLIAVMTDYDVDGLTSGALLTEAMRAKGGRVVTVAANRFDGGYGFSIEACNKVLASQASVLVTCDCGSSDHPRLERIRAAGIDALVIDHHLVPEKPLPVVGFLNPHRPECPSTDKDMCSAGLAWSVAIGIARELNLSDTIDFRQSLDLVALATIADVAPLRGDNRILVAHGLEAILRGRRPGMIALRELAKLDVTKPLTGRDVAWRLAPHINAPGRLGSPDIILRLFMATELDEAREIAKEMAAISDQRRTLTATMMEEAVTLIESHHYDSLPAIVVGDPKWNHGVVGIIAGRLVDKYGKPVVAIGHGGSGSVRGPAGSRLYDALNMCKAYTIKAGGHQAAAGCSIEWANLPAFRAAFCQAVQDQKLDPFVPDDITLEIDHRDSLLTVLQDLCQLEPCGQGNPRPRLVAEGKVAQAKLVKGGHLSLTLDFNDQNLKGFKVVSAQFSDPQQAMDLWDKQVVVIGDLRPTSFGRDRVEMFVEELHVVDG